jgi:streptogramin lyase
MMKKHSKVFFTLIALGVLVAGAALAFAATGNTSTFAKGPSKTNGAVDFSTPGSDPWGTTFDSSGNVWVALPGCDLGPYCAGGTFPGKIAEFNPTNDSWTRVYSLPSGFGQPLFLAFDKGGNLWFPMPMTNTLGELVLSTGKASQWTLPTPSAGPWDLAIDGNGNIWVTEHYTNKIAEFNPSTDKFVKEVATPAGNSQPYGITVDRSNNVWFTENNSAVALIAEYTASGQLEEYKIRNGSTSGLTPHLITIDTNGNPVWSEGWVSSIGRLNLSQAKPGTNSGVTEYTYHPPCATCGSHTSGIAVDHGGVVWFTDSLQSIFGSLNGSSFTFYNTPTGNSHPHDGLNVDSSNRVWFDEEFANKLARG